MRYPAIDRIAVRERLARGYSSVYAESDGDDPNEPVVVSEQDWLAAIAIAKRIYVDYLDQKSRFGPGDDRHNDYTPVELFVDRDDYAPVNILRYAASHGINIAAARDMSGVYGAVYALLWAYTDAEILADTSTST